MKQMTLATIKGFEVHGRATRKAAFLARMEMLVPWTAFYALIEPHYLKTGNGRPPVGLERMFLIFVFISTVGVNGAQTVLGKPFSETDKPNPYNTYTFPNGRPNKVCCILPLKPEWRWSSFALRLYMGRMYQEILAR
jgi:hypothetical protein